jgi:hypothetical protein
MKFLKFFSFFAFAVFIISSCQKELSFEAGTAKGSLKKDAFGDCNAFQVVGDYLKDTTLKATNYVDVQLNITTTGTYDIRTDTMNGYSFRATGAVAVTGLNTVRLIGSGKPILTGINVFTAKFDTSVCFFDVEVLGGVTAPPATFTLGTTGTNCTGATLAGTYTSGIGMTPANTVTLNVTVATGGSYNITTPTVNGVFFTGNGNLTTATTTIILTAQGTPPPAVAPVTSNYTVTAGTNSCAFSVTYAATPPPATFTVNCGAGVLAGTYTQGVPMTASNTYSITATSTGAGSYMITTAPVNGVTFTATGTFTNASTQPITLFAQGTPTASGPFSYATAGGTGSCTFSVTYTPATPPPGGGTITMVIGGGPVKTFNFAAIADTLSQGGAGYALTIAGDADATGIETFDASVLKSGAYFTSGSSYNVNQLLSGILVDANYTDSTGNDFSITSGGAPQSPGFTFTITTITPIRVTGTFSGTLTDAAGGTATKVITNGTYDLPLP